MNVFHGSNVSGLKVIKPRRSTHGKEWVYGARSEVISALFIGEKELRDLCCNLAVVKGKPVVTERFSGAFDYRYSGKNGSIYTLPSDGFLEGKTCWYQDIVCKGQVEVLDEKVIEDTGIYLRESGTKVNKYPDRPSWIPRDDSDLVEMFSGYGERSREWAYDIVCEFHPDLRDRVLDSWK